MPRIPLWILTCLLGLTSLQATDTSIDSSEARCRPEIIEEIPVPTAFSVFGFAYNNTAKTQAGTGRFKDAYPVTSPIIFNSAGPLKNVTYDSKTGELIVSEAGDYEVAYSIAPVVTGRFSVTKSISGYQMALAVNGKEVVQSRVETIATYRKKPASSIFVLKLAKNDGVSLILPGKPPRSGFYLSRKDAGISASLEVRKL